MRLIEDLDKRVNNNSASNGTQPAPINQSVEPVSNNAPIKPVDVPVDNPAQPKSALADGIANMLSAKPKVDKPERVAVQQSADTQQAQANNIVPPRQQTPEEIVKGTKDPYEALSILFGQNQPTDEELEKERKREKARAIISAIGDGVSSIANMYYTTKGAESMNFGASLSERNKQRYDAMMEKRKQNQDAFMKALVNQRLSEFEDEKKARQVAEQREYDDAVRAGKLADNITLEGVKQQSRFNLQNSKLEATANQSRLDRESREGIAKNRNNTTIRAASIRSGNFGSDNYYEIETPKASYKVSNKVLNNPGFTSDVISSLRKSPNMPPDLEIALNGDYRGAGKLNSTEIIKKYINIVPDLDNILSKYSTTTNTNNTTTTTQSLGKRANDIFK